MWVWPCSRSAAFGSVPAGARLCQSPWDRMLGLEKGTCLPLLMGSKGNLPEPAPEERRDDVLTDKSQVYALVEHYFPDLPKLELNAQEPRLGWDRWADTACDRLAVSPDNCQIT